MWNLESFDITEMVAMGAALRKLGTECRSMEELAQSTTRFLHTTLVRNDGTPALALARFFKTHAFESLPQDLKDSASEMMHPVVPWASLQCLTLLGTSGEHADWTSRRTSRGHRAIPLRDAAFVNGAPMVAALTKQLGIEAGALVAPKPELFMEQQHGTFNVFHVEDAVGSAVVPAQQEFVIPYAVRSVVGFGGVLPTGEMFAVIMFSKCSLASAIAPLFKPLALSLRSSVLQVAEHVFA